MIDTKKVKGRRSLRLESLDAALAEAERLSQIESQGKLVARGNWTLGQAVGHIAYWAERPYEGFPTLRPMPWPMRMLLKLMKGRMLNKGMPVGVKIPGVPDGTLGIDPMPTGAAIARLRDAFTRLSIESPTTPSPLFGRMTHDEWIALNLRHSELHLSFFE